jgi:hypothetical protein
MGQYIKYGIYAVIGFFILSNLFGGDSESETTTEEVAIPTQGLITVDQEMEKDKFKISDEVTIPDTSESLIVANYLDSTSDTFTLSEARLVEAGGGSSVARSVVRAASYGLFGYMIGRSMMSHRPNPNAYTDPKTHQKVTQNAGAKMNQTAARSTRTRPTSGKSGYGGGKSTRSYGG